MTLLDSIPTFREWFHLVLGGAIGYFANSLLGSVSLRRTQARELARLKSVNAAWKRFNALHPTLKLVQTGYAFDETFPEESVVMLLEPATFRLPNEIAAIRDRLSAGWQQQNLTNERKIGLKTWIQSEVSENPADVASGRNHLMKLTCHEYNYFDFLATHRRLVAGKPDEMPTLEKYLSEGDMYRSIIGFPNPLSVGLTLLCEGGRTLVLAIRSDQVQSGGDWHGGKHFNAVGENANPWDFIKGHDGVQKASPYSVARRGLYEEVGLTGPYLNACRVHLHSFAWAEDIRDHKFFGYALTDISRSEVEHLWQSAKSRSESKKLVFFTVTSQAQAGEFWRRVLKDADSWSPEAFFSTARTLLVLGRLKPSDLLPT